MAGTDACAIALPVQAAGGSDAHALFILPANVRQLGCPLPGASAPVRTTQAARAARAGEFSQGRALARRLLAEYGAAILDVPAAPDRSPVWPAGFVGSISHTADWVGVAVARACDVAAVGIDVEMIRPAAEVAHIDSVCLRAHELLLWEPAHCPRTVFSVLSFSAKEALYKCLHPIVRTFFDFLEAEVTAVEFASGTIIITLLCDLGRGFNRGRALEGRFAITADRVYTSFVL
jgi:enterobactin synthetase component D